MAGIVRGEVAVHARRLRSEHRRRCALFSGLALCLAGGGLAAVNAFPGSAGLALGLAVSFPVLLFAALARQRWISSARTSAGIEAEVKVARALEKLPAASVAHNVVLGHGDVDHVVLGPVCWAVETKYGRGVVSVSRGRVLVNGRPIPRDPLGQARQAASSLARRCGSPATALLVISEGKLQPECIDGVWVCSPKDLSLMFDRSAAVLPVERALSCAAGLPVASGEAPQGER